MENVLLKHHRKVLECISFLFVFILSGELCGQNTFSKVYYGLGERHSEVARIVVDDSGYIYTATGNPNAFNVFNYLTKISEEGEVVKDVVFRWTIVSLQLVEDELIVLLSDHNLQNVASTTYWYAMDLDLNKLDSSTILEPGLDYIYAADGGNGQEYTGVIALAADSMTEFGFAKVAFASLDENHKLDSIHWWSNIGNSELYGFAPLGEGYALRVGFDDTNNFGSFTAKLLYLDADLNVVSELAGGYVDFEPDSSGYWDKYQSIMGEANIMSLSNTTYIFSTSVRSSYMYSGWDYINDADIMLAKGNINSDTFTEMVVNHNLFENSYTLMKQMARVSDDRIVVVETRGSSFELAFNENSDSYVVISSYDTNLNLLWEEAYFQGDDLYQRAGLIQVKPDGNIVVVGTVFDKEIWEYRVFVIQANEEGKVITDTVGTEGIAETRTSSFSISPNPVKDVVFISPKSMNGQSTFYVLDTKGQCVEIFEGLGRHDVSNLVSGLYFIVANDGSACKMVKE